MNVSMDGKRIKYVGWLGLDGRDVSSIHASKDINLRFCATHHGEFDQFWVIKSEHGKEVSRYNCKTIDTIVWDNDA